MSSAGEARNAMRVSDLRTAAAAGTHSRGIFAFIEPPEVTGPGGERLPQGDLIVSEALARAEKMLGKALKDVDLLRARVFVGPIQVAAGKDPTQEVARVVA